MQGYRFSTDRHLPERDMLDLADILALQIHESLGPRVYLLPRSDVLELIAPYVDDLSPDDQHALSWVVWHLFQSAREFDLAAA
ncbi:hypothetical protein EYB53_009005 [Candidatus Chloroploca sp. M-50]|uniref:Uncharacterized protein n=2 Tax=Candidatus Chloroploca TaxID=1579476 RepID=A0A2H3L202_9CHLR|nr:MULTISPECIES: hypothetical protein [Candidatus Chloroploca]MBP1465841.1 hypothetical protein [Candidatus Chloroploca mongolica]PDV98737.1 hypothetical protein A9Q02_02025 [Candidatus Chloroploca asiatica]